MSGNLFCCLLLFIVYLKRVNHFQASNKSSELFIQPLNSIGAHSIAGSYLCQVSDRYDNHVNRTIHIFIHGNIDPNDQCLMSFFYFVDQLCDTPPPVANGNVMTYSRRPGSCYVVNCHHRYRLSGTIDTIT